MSADTGAPDVLELPEAVAGLPVAAQPAGEVLADLHDGLAGVRTDLRVLPEAVASAVAGSTARAVGAGLGDLRGAVERLEEGLPQDLAAWGSGLGERLADLGTRIAELTEVVRSLDARVAGMEHRLFEGAGGLGAAPVTLPAPARGRWQYTPPRP